MLAVGGEIADLEAHLTRLRESVAELYDARLPRGLRERVAAAAQAGPLLRMRLIAVPGAGGVELSVETSATATESEPVALAPVLLPGGLGRHKWVDRRLLAGLEQRLGAVPLLVDLDGDVLEAAFANLWIAEREVLVTPPLDGRFLPGTVRAALIAAAREAGIEVREEAISLERLGAADELLLSSSVRGLYPGTLAGREPRFELGARLRAALERRAAEAGRRPAPRTVIRPA